MFCSKCGSQVQDGVAYCPQCGAPMATGFSNNTSSNFSNNVGYQPNPTYGSSPVTSKSSNMNMVRIIASILVIIATFMPYISVSAYGFDDVYSFKLLSEGRDGIYFIGIAAAVIICDVLRKAGPSLALSIITFGITVYEILNTQKVVSDATDLLDDLGSVNYEAGFYCLILGAIGMVVAGPVMKAIEKKR